MASMELAVTKSVRACDSAGVGDPQVPAGGEARFGPVIKIGEVGSGEGLVGRVLFGGSDSRVENAISSCQGRLASVVYVAFEVALGMGGWRREGAAKVVYRAGKQFPEVQHRDGPEPGSAGGESFAGHGDTSLGRMQGS